MMHIESVLVIWKSRKPQFYFRDVYLRFQYCGSITVKLFGVSRAFGPCPIDFQPHQLLSSITPQRQSKNNCLNRYQQSCYGLIRIRSNTTFLYFCYAPLSYNPNVPDYEIYYQITSSCWLFYVWLVAKDNQKVKCQVGNILIP